MKTRSSYLGIGFAFVLLFALMTAVTATELVWIPINPSFGGYAGNASWLMASAQAQNDHVEEAEPYVRSDPFEDFEYTLKRSYLSRLSQVIIDEAFEDVDGLLPEGETEAHYSVGDYTIDITTDGVISVTIIDTLTGGTTTVEVPKY